MSRWQAHRHQDKITLIQTLEARLKLEPTPIQKLADDLHTPWDELIHRRLTVDCVYDYEHEMILRNRRYQEKPGAFVITPCKIKGSWQSVLVNRGFVSFAFMNRDQRMKLKRPVEASFIGLVKASVKHRVFSPSDPPTGGKNPWVDAWLRVDVRQIQNQIPYPLLPIYLEIIPADAPLIVDEQLVETKSGRDEMLLLGRDIDKTITAREKVLDPRYPIPVFDTVIPPGRHLGYVYEWAAMALGTILIGIILQMKRAQKLIAGSGESD